MFQDRPEKRNSMLMRRTPFLAALAIAALAVGAPAAGASTWRTDYLSGAPAFAASQPIGSAPLLAPSSAARTCGTITNEFTGTVAPSACRGAGGLAYIGPSVGQVATAIGPRS
jgi:hypothetical protein